MNKTHVQNAFHYFLYNIHNIYVDSETCLLLQLLKESDYLFPQLLVDSPVTYSICSGLVIKVSGFHAGCPGFEFRSIRHWIFQTTKSFLHL